MLPLLTLTPADIRASLGRLDKLAALATLSLLDPPPVPASPARPARRTPPGVEWVCSTTAAAAYAAGRTAAAWRVESAWATARPRDPCLPHADLPDRLEQAIANLLDIGLWPWPPASGPRQGGTASSPAPLTPPPRVPSPSTRPRPAPRALREPAPASGAPDRGAGPLRPLTRRPAPVAPARSGCLS